MISFGDNDWPGNGDYYGVTQLDMQGTKVHEVHHYHTWQNDKPTGYARWVDEFADPDNEHHDTSWCTVMNDRRW